MRPKVRSTDAGVVDLSQAAQVGPNEMSTIPRSGAKSGEHTHLGRPSSPDHAYYRQLRQRLEAHIALITVARKLVRRCYHTLRTAGNEAFAAAA